MTDTVLYCTSHNEKFVSVAPFSPPCSKLKEEWGSPFWSVTLQSLNRRAQPPSNAPSAIKYDMRLEEIRYMRTV